MRIPVDALIPAEKLVRYLLVPRPWDDKAKFLTQAGFGQGDPESLLAALRGLAAEAEAVSDRENEYGEFFRTMASWSARTAGSSALRRSGCASTSTVWCDS